MPSPTGEAPETYDVCLSFADEQRPYVDEVARLLENAGLRVFYDAFETADLWGRDLYTYMCEIYSIRSRFCVLFASADYSRKVWTNHERAAAQARALTSQNVYLLPVRFDHTRIPGILDSVGYIDATRTSPAELAVHLLAKFGQKTRHAGVLASVLALAADDLECAAGLRAVIDQNGIEVDFRSCSDRLAVAVIPDAELQPPDVLASIVPALEKPLARILLHHGELPSDPDLSSVDVADAGTAVCALAKTHRTGCVAVSHRVHAELIRSGGPMVSTFRKVALPRGAAAWDVYVRTAEEPTTPEAAPINNNTTIQQLTADNVVFGIQVTRGR